MINQCSKRGETETPCPCPALSLGRFCVSIEIHDNKTGRDIYSDAFDTDRHYSIREALRRAMDAAEAAERTV